MGTKISLSFSGGGALGIGYLGFLRVIQAANIPIDHVVTHSGASWMLNYLKSDMSDQEIIEHFSRFRLWRFIDLNSLSMGGILSLKRLVAHFEQVSGKATIESITEFTAAIVISDLTNPSSPLEKVITTGPLALNSVISSIVPPVFPLYEQQGKLYADGGYTSLYAARFLADKGSKIVGVYPDAFDNTSIPAFAKGFARVLKAISSQREMYENSLYPVNLEIRGFPTKSGLNDFAKAQEIYDAGRKLAQTHLDSISKLM